MGIFFRLKFSSIVIILNINHQVNISRPNDTLPITIMSTETTDHSSPGQDAPIFDPVFTPNLRRVNQKTAINTTNTSTSSSNADDHPNNPPPTKLRVSAEKTSLEHVAELLGVRLFKKYWIFGGSYWNENHIDKNNPCDINSVIFESRQHISSYKQLIFQTTTFAMMMLVSGFMSGYSENVFRLLFFIYMCYGYATLVQVYNIRQASRVLDKIDENCTQIGDNYTEHALYPPMRPRERFRCAASNFTVPNRNSTTDVNNPTEEDPLAGTPFIIMDSEPIAYLTDFSDTSSLSNALRFSYVALRGYNRSKVSKLYANKNDAIAEGKRLAAMDTQAVLDVFEKDYQPTGFIYPIN